jgi:hypothetical protein
MSRSNDDYETHLRSFNRFTRDIQDIRARAGTTRSTRPIAQPRRRLRDMRSSPPHSTQGPEASNTSAAPPSPDFAFANFLPDRRASPDVVQLSLAEVAATQDAAQARHLERRETRVAQRETSVERREKSVREREAALLERERALVIAESRVSRARNLVVAQMHEAEALRDRQRDDLRRALG